MDKQKFLNYALVAVITIIIFQSFSSKTEVENVVRDDLQIFTDKKITTSEAVSLVLQNNTAEKITLVNDCPNEPFNISKYQNGKWRQISAVTEEERCDSTDFEIAPNSKISVNYQPWQKDIFVEVGRYRVEISVDEKTFFHEIEIRASGFFGKIWQTIVYRPIYNLLVGLTSLAGHNFGWGIVLLTLLIRALLFGPFQKSLKSQRRLQKIQPQLDEIKKKYEGNQQMIAMETMALMKKNKVSMFGSCLPILIQMPFLLALFWATRDGLGENTLVHLYPFQSDFDLSAVSTNFFGFDLLTNGAQLYFILPFFLVVAQFIQMKLSLHHSKKNPNQKKTGENPMADAMQNMTKMMPYFMPAMIGFLAISMPAAVGIYWGTSTLFGIGQQFIVNRAIK